MTDVPFPPAPAHGGLEVTTGAALVFLILSLTISAAAQTGHTIEWESCGSVTHPPLGAVCATAVMPLHHLNVGGPTINLALKRVPARGTRRRQLWFLDGGPGDAATTSVERLAAVLDDPHLEVLTFDNRGTGESARLACPAQEDRGSPDGADVAREEWPACIEHIVAARTDLDALGTGEVVRDLHELIRLFRVDGVPVFVMGMSYGTYVTQRYLQAYPDQPDAIIVDGIVPLDWGFDEFDAGLDRIGRRILARCADDSSCVAHVGSDPVRQAEGLLARQREGHCYPLSLTPDVTRLVLGVGLMLDEIPAGVLAALVYRLNRCEWHDQMAVLHLFRNVLNDVSEPSSHTPVLQRHVSMSELWSPDAPDADRLNAALDDYLMSTEVSAAFALTRSSWPVYPHLEEGLRFPDYRGPMLMMHGSLDPTMPVERLSAFRAWYVGPEKYFVVMPDHGHVVVNESDCALDIYRQYLRNPMMIPDTSCVSQAAPLDFDVPPTLVRRMFGTEDLWGDRPSVLRSVLFLGLYRWGALAIGVLGLGAGVAAWRRRSASAPSRLRMILGLFGWVLVVAVTWQALFLLPYALPYVAAGTVAIGVTGLTVQTLLGRWLIGRLDRPRPVWFRRRSV
jgi:pimeloyl-ACP methyl ester carboxylesterase